MRDPWLARGISAASLRRLGACLVVLGLSLYSYLDLQSHLTQLRIQIPEMEKELRWIQEENTRLSYEVERFQSTSHLIELAHRPEFGHLKHPVLKEILTVQEAFASTE